MRVVSIFSTTSEIVSARFFPVVEMKGGASPKEQVLEACRRDNVELLQEVLGGMKGQSKEQIAAFFNTTTDTMGNFLLHVCACGHGPYRLHRATLGHAIRCLRLRSEHWRISLPD